MWPPPRKGKIPGHVASSVSTDPNRAKAIAEWQPSMNVKHLQAFLRGYRVLQTISEELHHCRKTSKSKRKQWKWEEAEQQAFETLRSSDLCSSVRRSRPQESLHSGHGCQHNVLAIRDVTAPIVAITLDERIFCYLGLLENLHSDQDAQKLHSRYVGQIHSHKI